MPQASTLLVDLGELLYRQREWANRAEIAQALGVHQQVVTSWLNYLEFFRAITERGRRITVSVDRLLSTLSASRAGSLRPERPVAISGGPEEVHEHLESRDVPHVFAMITAANRWAFYEPYRDVQLYVAREDRRQALAALEPLQPGRGGRGGTGTAGARLQVFQESLSGVASQRRDGLPVTTPFQTVIDLRAHPEGGAHADFLTSNLLPQMRGVEG